ncbi:hypothetical protein Q4Q52_20060 [Shewanella sp. SP1S2-4]|uniref:hypothetical protein n=1 Tax=Shewanella sp. SP1S2-4 TaxID=3063537 RepID=UPI00289051E6|nr:hypothetical protein [Shewanella sp. SP1S2-4]MDT3322032.1 hypothetical protein [Shewanella sp. SP1S2-4]
MVIKGIFNEGKYGMRFSDITNYSFSYREASEYVTEYWDELEDIYNSCEPMSGDKGKVWRQFHGKPHETSVLTVYLSQKVFEFESSLNESKKEIIKFEKKSKLLKLRVDEHEIELDNEKIKNKNLVIENEKNSIRLDDKAARALMDTILFLAKKCKSNGIIIDVKSLPHFNNISSKQIEYLKSLDDE